MSEIVTHLIAYYLGVGSAAGCWFYVDLGEWKESTTRINRVSQTIAFVLTWGHWVVILAMTRIVREIEERYEPSILSGGDGRV